ncbi:MAG: hypothetical protein ACOC6C_03045 [Verrucomicrobiota bacterium]
MTDEVRCLPQRAPTIYSLGMLPKADMFPGCSGFSKTRISLNGFSGVCDFECVSIVAQQEHSCGMDISAGRFHQRNTVFVDGGFSVIRTVREAKVVDGDRACG